MTQVTSAPNVIVVHPSMPAKTVKELIALAKAKPGKIDYASSGNGSTQHLTGALFMQDGRHRDDAHPYRGSGPATADLLSGQVRSDFPGIAGMLPQIKAGKLRALAVTSAKRSPELPDTPTVAEAGIKGYDVTAWFGVAGPKGMPRDIVLKLHTELLRILKNAEVQKLLFNAGQEVAWQETPEQFGEMLKSGGGEMGAHGKESGAPSIRRHRIRCDRVLCQEFASDQACRHGHAACRAARFAGLVVALASRTRRSIPCVRSA